MFNSDPDTVASMDWVAMPSLRIKLVWMNDSIISGAPPMITS